MDNICQQEKLTETCNTLTEKFYPFQHGKIVYAGYFEAFGKQVCIRYKSGRPKVKS